MKLLIQFPTRSRPERFKKYLSRYLAYIEDSNNFHIQVSCDKGDTSVPVEFISKLRNVSVVINNNQNKIEAINANVPFTGWDILLLASDDMWPEVYGFDNIIREQMQMHFPDTDGVLHFNDGIHGDSLNTLAIIGNKYYQRFGFIYNPKYKSLYADNEFDQISRQLDKYKYNNQVIISHQRKKVKRDYLHIINHKYASEDKLEYEKWKKSNII